VEDYQDRLSIATPEGIRVDLVLAGLGSRFTAALLDLAIKAVLLLAVAGIAVLLGDAGVAVLSVASLLVYLGYDIAFETLSRGQTPGKRLTSLRVLRADGRAVDLLSSAIRNVMRLIDGVTLAYLPGMVSILLTSRHQRIGDLAARTIVIRELAAAAPAPAAPRPPLGDVPRPGVPPGALDVSAVTAQDVASVRAFLVRRATLEEPVRGDLAARLAGALRPRLGGGAELRDEELLEHVLAAKERGGAGG